MTRHELHDLYRKQQHTRRRRTRQQRRGVLLMVVLAMLALFLLLGTAFLITSDHYRVSNKEQAKNNRVNNQPGDELERAMLQLVRDTNNPHSVIRWHSLFRDMYGTDGFIGRVFANDSLPNFVAQYAGATLAGSPSALGATEGQFIDIYVLDAPLAASERVLNAKHVIKIEPGPNGLAVNHQLPGANGYYAGCLLTMLEGPAAGKTTRIIDYTFVGAAVDRVNPPPLYRLRVMGFPQANGEPLNIGGIDRGSRPLELRELVGVNPNDPSIYQGYAFLVNGRPHNGTGVGLNLTAATGQAKLSALEALVAPGGTGDYFTDRNGFAEIALLPNATTFNVGLFDNKGNSRIWAAVATGRGVTYRQLNESSTGAFAYTSFEGPGGSDESYDAVDYQNMFLAGMPLTPRARGGYFINVNGVPTQIPADQSQVDFSSTPFLSLDLENVPIPSFHRPALINYWYHRLLNSSFVTAEASNAQEAAAAILLPYGADGIRNTADDPKDIDVAFRDQIVALKRKFLMRPLREDHPGFNGSNPLSHYSGVTSPVDSTGVAIVGVQNGQIQFPFWEAVGPWDVDNDGDGIPDSVWVDIGEPVQETEDGRLYRRLITYHVVDLDNRLDLNAHGSPEHMVRQDLPINDLDPTRNNAFNNINLVGGSTSNIMPAGMGWGTADTSLRPVLSPQLPTGFPLLVGDSQYDDYARLLAGTPLVDGFGRVRSEEWGKLGSTVLFVTTTPGLAFNPTNAATILATRDRHTWFDFAGYPEQDVLRAQRLGLPYTLTQFGESPDLKSRYAAVGVGYGGQVVNEAVWDSVKPNYDALNFPVAANAIGAFPSVPLIDDSMYEIDISFDARKDIPQGAGANDDAAFATAELERLLRSYDADVGALPNRLWNLVDAFNPVWYAETLDANAANGYTPEELALAQTVTAINRRSVTTDTAHAPVPSEQVPGYVTELGVDGQPGNAGVDDDGNGAIDDLIEVGFRVPVTGNTLLLTQWSDDFASLTGKNVSQARLVDVAWYRIQKSRIERGMAPFNVDNALAVTELNKICDQILPPEVMRGEKMDLNRPFGDGLDNNNNGVIDEPIEAGEPMVNGNFLDFNGNGVQDPPLNTFQSDVVGETAQGDIVMGKDVTGNGLLTDDQHLARQLYARHLYVLMLLLTDENYVTPYDYQDPQVRRYLRLQQAAFEAETPPKSPQVAKLLAQRKLTMREIAQWAINAADYRDADAICTPFEYDENPWDGWNLTQNGGTIVLPIDSDPATNENSGQSIDWANIEHDRTRWSTTAPIRNAKPILTPNTNPFANISEQTRGLVWGAERPELLMTENLNMHDRRTEDGRSTSTDGHKARRDPQSNDQDNDQRLRPRGSSFVELYNPWGNDSQKPIELYSKVDPRTGLFIPSQGVELGRLSNFATADGYRSPVWRMIVVEEFPEHRNNAGIDNAPVTRDNTRSHPLAQFPEHRDAGRRWDPDGMQMADANDPANGRWNFRFTNPDWTEMYTRRFTNPNTGNSRFVPMEEWKLTQTNTQAAQYADPTDQNAVDFDRHLIIKPYPYIEREFYFTSGNNQDFNRAAGGLNPRHRQYTNLTNNDFFRALRSVEAAGLRMPIRFVETTPSKTGAKTYSLAFRYLAKTTPVSNRDVEIAPIMPGRFAVVGDAGTRYPQYMTSTAGAPRFSTTIGRINAGSPEPTPDTEHARPQSLERVRRIELLPSLDPNVQQLLVGNNGAAPGPNPGDRMNEVFRYATANGQFAMAGDSQGGNNYPGDGEPDSAIVMPTVAIPVDDFNISEPVYGYELREYEAQQVEWPADRVLEWRAEGGQGEGSYTSAGGEEGYDMPFDNEPELTRTGTTPNYRVMHLQRLADPTMPWNPPPDYLSHETDNQGRSVMQHDPSLPINPYLTVDSSSMDITAFNGTHDEPADVPIQNLSFHSLERGRLAAGRIVNRVTKAASRLLTTSGNPTPAEQLPIRNLFTQELPRKRVQLSKEQTPFRQDIPGPVNTDVPVTRNYFDRLFIHSLGYANDAYFDMYIQSGPIEVRAPTGSAIGMPRPVYDDVNNTPGNFNDDVVNPETRKTYQSFPWANRPFISGAEIMQVPATSQATMLRDFSTPNPNSPSTISAYSDVGLRDSNGTLTANPAMADAEQTNKARWAAKQSYFGHLLNFFQAYGPAASTAAIPASGTNPADAAGIGAPNFYRLFDYAHVPSRYSHTDTMLPPSLFNMAGSVARGTFAITDVNDPRWGHSAPFNRVDNYSEPGRINLNTVVGRRVPDVGSRGSTRRLGPQGARQVWSLVYDGLMHRWQDGPNDTLGHLGPSWGDVVISRRGYPSGTDKYNASGTPTPDAIGQVLNNGYPTMFANPFRAPNEGELVPLQNMVLEGIDGTLMRPHHYLPGNKQAWGAPGVDDDGNGWVDDTREAGYGDDVIDNGTDASAIRHPLFSAGALGPTTNTVAGTTTSNAIDALRNPGMQYQPLTRLENLTTTRSGVFAVWVTVGYFEVSKAPSWDDTSNGVAEKFTNQAGGDPIRGRALYNAVYPEGYTLGKEIGIDNGQVKRHRGFYMIDRTRPVGFKPGEDVNIEDAILLRRRIE